MKPMSLFPWLSPTMPPTMRELTVEVAERHGLSLEQIKSLSRRHGLIEPRREAIVEIMRTRRWNAAEVGRFFGLDRTMIWRTYRRAQCR